MALLPVDLLGAQGGFVAASDVVNGLLGGAIVAVVAAGAGVAAAAGIGGGAGVGATAAIAGDGVASAGAVAGGPRAMRWNNNTSGFVHLWLCP
jgi:hypothetical protein